MKKKAVVFMLSLSFLLIGCSVKDSHDTIVSGSNNSVGNETNKTAGGAVVDVPVDVGVTVSSDEYNELKNKINQLESQNAELQEQVEVAQSQLQNIPIINYANIGLQINGDEIPVNSTNALIVIDGKDYISKEVVEKMIEGNRHLTIKDGNAYIGKIVSSKANLFDKWILNQMNCGFVDSITDSYGNIYANSYGFWQRSGSVIFNLNNEFSLMKLTIAIREDSEMDKKGVLTIKADDEIVYTSNNLDKKTEPFTVEDIPIYNCMLLSIEYAADTDRNDCIISNAIVYNE